MRSSQCVLNDKNASQLSNMGKVSSCFVLTHLGIRPWYSCWFLQSPSPCLHRSLSGQGTTLHCLLVVLHSLDPWMCEPQNGVVDDDRCSDHSVFDIFDHGHHGPSWPVMVAWGLFALWHPQSGQARESFQSWGRRQVVKILKIKVYHVRHLRVCFHWRLILDIVIYVYIYIWYICYCI